MSAKRWHIGHNMLGYMPTDPPYCIRGSERDAQQAARDEAEFLLDSENESLSGSAGDYWIEPGDGHGASYHVWYAPCEEFDQCEREINVL